MLCWYFIGFLVYVLQNMEHLHFDIKRLKTSHHDALDSLHRSKMTDQNLNGPDI